MKTPRSTIAVFGTLGALLAATVVVSLLLGGSSLPPARVMYGLLHPGDSGTAATILWKLRFPRVLLGILVGMGLAAGGSVFQGMLRNPLADPYTLGISGGAAFGAALGIVTGLAGTHRLFLPVCAFAGTLLAVGTVYAVTARRRFSSHTLILAGVILGFLFSSLVLLLFAVSSPSKIQSTIIWLMGDLSSADAGIAGVAAAFVLPGTALLCLLGGHLNVLSLGDEKALHLGVEAETVRKALFLAASFITAACVAAAGVVGFVGLMVPHFMRRFTGPDHRALIPASALGGAILLPLCDAVARTAAAPVELPVGVITGFAGGLFFLGFLRGGEKTA